MIKIAVTCTTLNKTTETSPLEIKSVHLKQRQDFKTMLEMALGHHSELSFTGWAFVCNHVQSKQFSYFKNVSHGGRKGYWSPLVVTFALTLLFSVCLSIWILIQVSSCTVTFILIQGILAFISNKHYVGERLRTVMTTLCLYIIILLYLFNRGCLKDSLQPTLICPNLLWKDCSMLYLISKSEEASDGIHSSHKV